jgi:RimJ/RimL family protein N-acetyltransferase
MKEILQTERCIIRELTPEDAAFAFELNLDPLVLQFTGDGPFASLEDAKSFLENYDYNKLHRMGRWGVVRKSDEKVIGWCGLKYHPDIDEVDLGYRFLIEHRNEGYATEASLACIDYGFNTLNLERIVANAVKENGASIKVMEKVGMKFCKETILHGQTSVQYEIFRENK